MACCIDGALCVCLSCIVASGLLPFSNLRRPSHAGDCLSPHSMSGHGAPHIEVPAKRPRADDGRSGTSMEKRTPKGWISYGEILTAVIEGRSLGIQDIFHDRGRQQSKAYWESQASEQGCHLKIRGRKRGNNNVFRTVIVVTGPQGCTRPFYKRFREFFGRSLE